MSGRSTDGPTVSVVLPAYNEAATIEATVRTTLSTLAEFLPDDAYEVIVAEDGCEDRTPEIADRMAAEDDRVRHFHSDERLGRGGALERAFRESDGDVLVYFDTDLATDMRHLEELVESVRTGGYDVATGSRWLPENRADRPAKRGIPSLGYNTLVRLFLGSDLRDHQCGFKAFEREALLDLLDAVEDDHWFWDTELLVKAQARGLRIKEFPVDWEPKGDTKVDLVRDIFGMGSQILRTWWEMAVQPRITRRVTLVAGVLLSIFALGLMTLYIPVSEVVAAARDADPALVAAAAGVYVLSWPLRGIRYRDILAEQGHDEDWRFLTGAVFISQTGNLVFPARAGDFVRAYVMKLRRSVPYPTGFASLAVERVFDLLTISLLAGTVLVGLVATGQTDQIATAIATADQTGTLNKAAAETALSVAAGVGLAAILAVVAIVASARSDGNYVRRALSAVSSDSYVEYVAGVLEQFVAEVQTVAESTEAFARVGAASVLIWTLDVLTAALVLLAFEPAGVGPVTLLSISFFAVSVGNLAKVLPLSPGGIGLYEAAFTLLVWGLTPIGAGTAFAAALVDHTVKNLVTVVGGSVSMLKLNVSLTNAVDESAAEAHDSADPEQAD